jgi:hypothetical protein
MKKLLMILSLSLLSSGSATSNELSSNSINKLIESGYKIISEDIVSSSNSNRFIKTFTLQNKKSSLVICNITFGNDGFLDDYRCIKP